MTKYFEDFAVGTEFESRSSYRVTLDEIRSFAFKWDPWPYHLDEE
jgi:acyl dehydratase